MSHGLRDGLKGKIAAPNAGERFTKTVENENADHRRETGGHKYRRRKDFIH